MHKVKLYGGLGNQMFQYAFMLYLKKHSAKARISFSNFLHLYYHNGFDLGRAFRLKMPVWQKMQNVFLKYGKLFYHTRYISFPVKRMARMISQRHKNVYCEKELFRFDSTVVSLNPSYFVGTWQSVKYIDDVKSELLNDFSFVPPSDAENKRIANMICQTNAVSLHIRRGDYLHSEWKDSFAILQDLAYYQKAIDVIRERTENPVFFNFSDDPKWVEENLHLPGAIYVNHNCGSNSYLDMYLMSLCKHNIIANSTFSWWGAWLNKNKNKIVVMPSPWLKDTDCAGIYPDDWLKISATKDQ